MTAFPHAALVFFDNAPDLIAWLPAHLPAVALICLDHDLGPNGMREGRIFDPGTGRDVADDLVTRPPTCPILIHSTNYDGAMGMLYALTDAGWPVARIRPGPDLLWVTDSWLPAVIRALHHTGPAPRPMVE